MDIKSRYEFMVRQALLAEPIDWEAAERAAKKVRELDGLQHQARGGQLDKRE